MGVFLEGYLTNMDPMSIVANGIQLILSLVVWYPFFKIYEKRYQQKENDKNNMSKEDEEILKDLDLDF